MLRTFVCVWFILCCLTTAWAVPPQLPGWDVAWFDEFDGNQLNTNIWNAIFSTSPTNESLHAYLPDQVSVDGGNLVITSTNQPYFGLPYRSGQVISKIDQQYGKWEVRANLPTTKGQWPAIWLLPNVSTNPWPSQGEIDIMENRGDQPNLTSSAFHYGTNPPYNHSYVYGEQSARQNGQPQNYHNDFHTYGVEWTDQHLRFFVDGVNYYTVYDDEVGGFLSSQTAQMETVINNAIGGWFLDNPDGSTVWPQQMLVDYVHVYEASATPAPLVHENGSFDGGQSPLAGWSTFGVKDFGNVQPHNEAVRSGSNSLKLYGQFDGSTNNSGIEQGITVSPGDEVRALLHEFIRSNDSISGSGNELLISIDYYSQRHGRYGSSSYLGSDSVVVADGSTQNNAWLERELRGVAPAGAVEARMAIKFVQRNNAGGAVHVDDTVFGLRGQNVMTWDQAGDGFWDADRWLGAGPTIPTDFDAATIRTNRVTVAGSQEAFLTTVESGVLDISGTLNGDVLVDTAGTIINRGAVIGQLNLDGTLAVESVSTLNIQGDVLINEALLLIADTYTQTRGTYTGPFALIEADSITGQFSEMSSDHLGDGLFLNQLSNDGNSLLTDLYLAIPGDANGDGIVDAADFSVWNQFKFQSGTNWTEGDFNGDGSTDGRDLLIWNEHKFQTANLLAVPEPQGLMLLLLGLCAWCRRSRD